MTNYKNPPRYRLDFIRENTFNRVWSIRMTRPRVILGSLAIIAGMAALLWVIFAFTPMRQLLPGALRGNLRNQYLETALRLDSLEQSAKINQAYIDNIVAILNDELPSDSIKEIAEAQVILSDSLLAASEAEQRFVEQYRDEERFNLSVLSPIAAEGMVFSSPASVGAEITDISDVVPGVSIAAHGQTPASAVYRGTILTTTTLADGTTTVVIQHPNDFISVYSGLSDIYVSRGKKVLAGQRIGAGSSGSPVVYELWHNGSPLNPRDYIPF